MAKQTSDETIVDVQKVISSSETFLEKNRKPLAIGLGAIAVVFAGFFAFQYLYAKPKEAEAADLAYVCDYWAEQDSLEKAVKGVDGADGFEAIAEQYGGTKTGKRAHFWCGVYYRDVVADYATALEHFKQADFDDNAVGVEAIGCVGDMYIMQNNIEEGAAWLEKAAKQANNSASRDFTGPVYGLKAAKAYLELGKDDKARSLLQYILENYDRRNTDYSEAEKLLAYVNAKGNS